MPAAPSDRAVLVRTWAIALLAAVPCAFLFAGYVKDDAYIAFRYARNLVDGAGLVFNPGERVEGYTDFLWVMLAAAIHPLDPGDGSVVLAFARAVGVGSAVALAAATTSIARLLGARGTPLAEAWALVAGVVVATHPAVAVWSMSGLEPVPFAALVAWSVERALAGRPTASFRIALAAVLLRPEGHVVLGFVVLLSFLQRLERDGPAAAAAATARALALPLALVVLYHAGRYAWFGSLVPNTYRVKSSGGHASYPGFEAALTAASLGAGPGLLLAGVFAVGVLRRRVVALLVALGLSFFAYLWWVGGDEMRYGRLVIGAWPLLAAPGAAAFVVASSLLPTGRPGRIVAASLIAVVGIAGTGAGLAGQLALAPTLAPYQVRMDASQRALGEYLQSRLPAGSLVAYQDMGLCPYAAPDLRFLDLVGLVSKEVADLRDREGVRLSGVESGDRQAGGEARERFKANLRDLVFERRPEAIALQAELPEDQAPALLARARDLAASDLAPLCGGTFSAGLGGDPRLLAGYHLDRVFPRPPRLIFTVFLRNDLAAP